MSKWFMLGLTSALMLFICSDTLLAQYKPMPSKNAFFTGNDVYAWCTGGVGTRGLVAGYAAGVWDALAKAFGESQLGLSEPKDPGYSLGEHLGANR